MQILPWNAGSLASCAILRLPTLRAKDEIVFENYHKMGNFP
jgi:hypothetical protein